MDVLYKDLEENVLKRFVSKWITILAGLIVSTLLALIIKDWCLILPLLIALLVSALWMFIYPKHTSLRASIKSWYLVIVARMKTMMKPQMPIKPKEDVPKEVSKEADKVKPEKK